MLSAGEGGGLEWKRCRKGELEAELDEGSCVENEGGGNRWAIAGGECEERGET